MIQILIKTIAVVKKCSNMSSFVKFVTQLTNHLSIVIESNSNIYGVNLARSKIIAAAESVQRRY